MAGPHDVGGAPTDEPIDRGEHEWADWERQTAAMMGAVRSAGLMTVDEMRRLDGDHPGGEGHYLVGRGERQSEVAGRAVGVTCG